MDKVKILAGLVPVGNGQYIGTQKEWQRAEELQEQVDEMVECEVDEILISNK